MASRTVKLGPIHVGGSLKIRGNFTNESGAPANPDTQTAVTYGPGAPGTVALTPFQADTPVVGEWFVRILGEAAGIVNLNWRGSGSGINPAAQQASIEVLDSNIP